MIKIEKDIFVRDRHGVKRTAFVAGAEVEEYHINAVKRGNAIVNPEDLPGAKKETKTLPVEEKPEKEAEQKEEKKEEAPKSEPKKEAEPKAEPKKEDAKETKKETPKK